MENIDYPGTLFTVSAPSGAGKTSLVQAWLEHSEHLNVSVSYTTRQRRDGERDGVNYFFVDKARFQSMITAGEFFEYAEVFHNFYGTTKAGIAEKLAQGIDVVLEIDCQGARQVKKQYPKAVAVFILPPSFEILQERLFRRDREHKDEIKMRLEQAKQEIAHCYEADYLLINDDFGMALQSLCELQKVVNMKVASQSYRHQALLRKLLD